MPEHTFDIRERINIGYHFVYGHFSQSHGVLGHDVWKGVWAHELKLFQPVDHPRIPIEKDMLSMMPCNFRRNAM